LKLHTLTLSPQDQKRLQALMDLTERELILLDDKILRAKSIEAPYTQPKSSYEKVARLHREIKRHLERTHQYIHKLEPVMRTVVNAELNKHEERMRYYSAQARLAKARLYDNELMALEDAQFTNAGNTTGAGQ